MRFNVYTTSMQPVLRPGDALIVEGGAIAEVTPGAIVVVHNGNVWIVHRLIRRRVVGGRLCLQTKGDNRSRADSGIDGSAPIGVVKSVERGERSLSLLTWRARHGGRVLACLSRAQAGLYVPAPGVLRRLIMGGMRRGIYILALLVYKL